MTLELRIPISPTPAFLNRARLLVASARRFYPDCIARVYVGQETVTEADAARVREAFTGQNIAWEWVRGREFMAWSDSRSPYLATMNARWKTPVDGDFVLILDCDVLMVARIDELFEYDAAVGVQAHVAPLDDASWRYLFAVAGCEPPPFDHVYSGAGIMGPPGQKGPFYPNSGFVLFPKELFGRVTPFYHEAINILRSAMTDSYWFDQLALAIAVAKSGVPAATVPVKFNFPNQKAFDEAYPEELQDVRVLHFLRTNTIDRDRDFADLATIRRLVARTDMVGSNEIVRRTVAETMACLEPPRLERAEDAPWA